MAGSQFAHWFTRNLGLSLLKRNPDQWKINKAKEHKAATSSNAISTENAKQTSAEEFTATQEKSHKKRKRKDPEQQDEIDMLFSGVGAYKRVGGLASGEVKAEEVPQSYSKPTTVDLDKALLNAIKAAPHDSGPPSKKKKKK